MRVLFEGFDRLDTAPNRWLVAHSLTLMRVSLGLVFPAFGALGFFPGPRPHRRPGDEHDDRAHLRARPAGRGAGDGRRAGGGRRRPVLRYGQVFAGRSVAYGGADDRGNVPTGAVPRGAVRRSLPSHDRRGAAHRQGRDAGGRGRGGGVHLGGRSHRGPSQEHREHPSHDGASQGRRFSWRRTRRSRPRPQGRGLQELRGGAGLRAPEVIRTRKNLRVRKVGSRDPR